MTLDIKTLSSKRQVTTNRWQEVFRLQIIKNYFFEVRFGTQCRTQKFPLEADSFNVVTHSHTQQFVSFTILHQAGKGCATDTAIKIRLLDKWPKYIKNGFFFVGNLRKFNETSANLYVTSVFDKLHPHEFVMFDLVVMI